MSANEFQNKNFSLLIKFNEETTTIRGEKIPNGRINDKDGSQEVIGGVYT